MTQQTVPQNTPASSEQPRPLVDRFGRVHRSMRLSVIDMCNIRCQYCMPAEGVQFLPPDALLSFEAITEVVEAMVELGVTNFRLTGGEPLLRKDLHLLARKLVGVPGIDDLALTTNGMLLDKQLEPLVEAGVRRINISLDTLQEAIFQKLSRREGLDKVLQGIKVAAQHPEVELKLNALILRDVNLSEVVELTEFAMQHKVTLRFIEFMPLDAERAWSDQRMVSGEELRTVLRKRFGELQPLSDQDSARPARNFQFQNLPGTVGFIDSVSKPFCQACDRLRLTAEGKLRNCLFGKEEWDVAQVLRDSAAADPASRRKNLQQLARHCVTAKHPSHGIAEADFEPPQRAMYQIGG